MWGPQRAIPGILRTVNPFPTNCKLQKITCFRGFTTSVEGHDLRSSQSLDGLIKWTTQVDLHIQVRQRVAVDRHFLNQCCNSSEAILPWPYLREGTLNQCRLAVSHKRNASAARRTFACTAVKLGPLVPDRWFHRSDCLSPCSGHGRIREVLRGL